MKPKIVAIIQARLTSTRLPGKVLLPLSHGNRAIEWVVDRVRASLKISDYVVAIPHNYRNWDLKQFLRSKKINYFRWPGPEDDVMSRVIAAAEEYKADIIVEITADCPMVDPRHIDRLISSKLKKKSHYVSNCMVRSWPDGLDIQVYDIDVLKYVQKKYSPKFHVGWNIWNNRNNFLITTHIAPDRYRWPELGLTLDTEEDYTLLQHLFKIFGRRTDFKVESVIDYLRKNPLLVNINKAIKRKAPEEG